MKKISKFILKENAEILEKDEMKLILGGSYKCCCGMGSNIDCSNYIALSFDDAVYDVVYACGGGPAGCFSN